MYPALRGSFFNSELFWVPARSFATLIGDFLKCKLFTKPLPEQENALSYQIFEVVVSKHLARMDMFQYGFGNVPTQWDHLGMSTK